MAIKGTYNGGDKDIKATEDGHLIVRSIIEEEIEHASADGNSFAFRVAEAAIDTTDTVLFFKNEDDAVFIPDRVTLGADDSEKMQWDICIGSATTTPVAGGGTITPVNLYQTYSGKTFDHTAMYDETAVAQGSIIDTHNVKAAETSLTVNLNGIILGKGHYIQIDVTGTTPVVGCTMWGHWQMEAI
jgi:hypothetical protein